MEAAAPLPRWLHLAAAELNVTQTPAFSGETRERSRQKLVALGHVNWSSGMTFDPTNPVVALCVAGVEREGTPVEALALYEQAWAARTDDFDASVAAHYVARLQNTPAMTLHWNAIALEHAELVADARLATLLPSLCLNLAESYRVVGREEESRRVARRGYDALAGLPVGGYAEMVRGGLDRVLARLDAAAV